MQRFEVRLLSVTLGKTVSDFGITVHFENLIVGETTNACWVRARMSANSWRKRTIDVSHELFL